MNGHTAFRSGNPSLNKNTFKSFSITTENQMTLDGTVNKTGISLLLLMFTATYTWNSPSLGLMALGGIGGFIVGILTHFKRHLSAITVPIYAALEGLLLGGITWIFEVSTGIEGLGIISAGITFLILGVMITIYRLGLIHWDKNMQIAVTSSMMAIMLIYLISILGSFLGYNMPYIHGSGTIGIAFSVFVVGIASLCLVADFDFIERGVLKGAPKQLEWRAAFGLLVTLAWLYLEILKLVSKIAASRN